MKQYLHLMKEILINGKDHEDSTGVGRRSLFGKELRFDLRDGFPLVTTRKIFTKALIVENLWFLSGSNDATKLQEQGVKIWDKWTPTAEDAEKFIDSIKDRQLKRLSSEMIRSRVGTIGPMYGNVWRGKDKVDGFDQIKSLINGLKTQPFGSRHCVTAWIPDYLPYSHLSPKENVLIGQGALAPCHCFFQCFVTEATNGGKNRLSLKLEIRSSDGPIGLPYNIAQYAMLLTIFAKCVDMTPYELIVSIGDAHIYSDQVELMKQQILLEPKRDLPTLWVNPEKNDVDSFVFDDFKIIGYDPHPVINYPVAT